MKKAVVELMLLKLVLLAKSYTESLQCVICICIYTLTVKQ